MTTLEIIIAIAGTGIFSGVMAIFYRSGRNQERVDNGFKSMDDKFKTVNERLDKIDSKIDNVEKDLQQLNTRMAVVESRLNDISINVSHLMWHSQAIPQKDAQEQ